MLEISISDESNRYELTELAKMFVPAEELDLFSKSPDAFCVPDSRSADRNAQKRALYRYLSEKTGRELDWGILTGVRPLKLFCAAVKDHGSPEEAVDCLIGTYLLSREKAALLRDTWQAQQSVRTDSDPKAVGLYIGIPFCPTRCLYCSFTSNRYSEDNAERYLKALYKEISAVSEIMDRNGLCAESIYIGGGTPTSLSEEQFEEMTDRVSKAFKRPKTAEFTVECGRPDTMSGGKLSALKKAGAGRISINPQSMQQKTLDRIGRQHTPEEITEAFSLARSFGIESINMDLIAGLPGEETGDFADTLEKICALGPENITVHTLAVKKGSRLIEQDRDYSYRQGDTVKSMVDLARNTLRSRGYAPYYLYRQKHMAGNLENVGYCLPGTASMYNIRIMQEDQTILALGAGGVSKLYYPEEDRIERVANVSNYEIYIDRIDEMIKRKEAVL
ncbi:MAG: coproporphyrinogen dehydrogenase HemZ [Firmicutes bacterium]|nr:coproporphyrinogen dehydrogenase HemZ [Bacillota bacterium]